MMITLYLSCAEKLTVKPALVYGTTQKGTNKRNCSKLKKNTARYKQTIYKLQYIHGVSYFPDPIGYRCKTFK